MIPPKQTHLVERVAERLLRAGALEGSAAQLLEPDDRPAPARPRPIAPATAGHFAAPAAAAEALVAEPPPAPVDQTNDTGLISARTMIEMAALERAGVFDWTHGRSRISEEFRLASRLRPRT